MERRDGDHNSDDTSGSDPFVGTDECRGGR
jgi:hypothetical protein